MKQPLFTKLCCDIFVIYLSPILGRKRNGCLGRELRSGRVEGYRVNVKSWNEKFQNVFDIWIFHIFQSFLLHLVSGTAVVFSLAREANVFRQNCSSVEI